MTREIVIDGSAAVPWVLADERTDHSERLLALVQKREVKLVVPELWHYEILNALSVAVARGRIEEHDASRAVVLLDRVPVESVAAATQGRAGVLSAAGRHSLSAYDATYLHLAESRGLALVSSDTHHLRLRHRFSWILAVEDFCPEP